jgi:hypothetical protein
MASDPFQVGLAAAFMPRSSPIFPCPGHRNKGVGSSELWGIRTTQEETRPVHRLDYLEFAVLGELPPELPPRQFWGLPPDLTGGVDRRRVMPQAAVLVLMRDPYGSIFLYRFDSAGAFSGDTWHQDVVEAKRQATFEYGNAVGDWHAVPDDITDIGAFVRSLRKTDCSM